MEGLMRTTGKVYEPNTYKCTACGTVYPESKDCRCPACGSDQREEHQQTVASLAEEKSLAERCAKEEDHRDAPEN